MTINTYLHFNGNCEEALNFYAKALGMKLAFCALQRSARRVTNAAGNCAPKSCMAASSPAAT